MDTTITDTTKVVAPIDPTIPAGQIGNTTGIKIPPAVEPINLLAGLASTTQQTADQSTAQEKTTQIDYNSLLKQLEGETADISAIETQQGVPVLNKELLDLQKVANKQTAEYLAGYAGQEAKRQTRQETSVAQQNLTRQNAIDALLTNSLISAKQGDITFANSLVDRAIKAKYDPIKARIETQKEILRQVEGKASADRQTALNIQLKNIEKKETEEKGIQDLMLEAVKNGADQNTISAIGKAKDFNEALKVSGGFLATPQTDIVKLDNGNTIMVDKRTGKIIKSFGGAKAEAGTGGYAVTNNALKTVYNNDAVALISNIIKDSKAKPNQSMTDAINVIAGVQELAKANPTGKFPGIAPIRLTPNKLASKEALTNKSNIAAINLKVQQWASGASLTEQQTKAVEKLTPDKNDTDKQVRTKLNSLANYMMSQVSGQLAGQGISFTNDKSIDYFEPSSEEQLKTYYNDPVKSKQIEKTIALYPDATADEILQIIE